MDAYLKTISRYQDAVKKEITSFFDREIKKVKAPFLAQTLRVLKEYSLRPAKRVRAILVIYGYYLAGGKNIKEIIKTSIFIELIHNFLLVHDDIIDRDEMRRGKKTLHRQYQQLGIQEKEHYGLSMALAAGDIMETLARKALSQANFNKSSVAKAEEKLNEVLMRTMYGEMFEMEQKKHFLAGKRAQEKDVMDVYRNKTAFYTFVGPMQMGMLLAGGAKKHLYFAEKIGFPLGIAYQMIDDLDDASGSDVKEGQPNLLIIKAMASKQGSALRKYLGRGLINKNSKKRIQKIIAESGATVYSTAMIKKLILEAKKNISLSQYTKNYKQFLINLADYMLQQI